MKPFVSCICPTYGRCPDYQHLVEQAIACFLKQDYDGPLELLVGNDCPAQCLTCNRPNVRVLNAPERFTSLGGKYNWLITAALGDIILPWEDDDFSLPHRVSQAVERLDGFYYFNPQQLFYWERGKEPVRDHGGVCHNASAYRKDAWRSVGGYPHVSGNQDALFDRALRSLGASAKPLSPEEVPSYVYRWGVSPLHLSGNPDHEKAYRDYGKLPSQKGQFDLLP